MKLNALRFVALIAGLALLLEGCIDQTENVFLMDAEGKPFRCPDQEKTRYEFVAPVTVDGKVVYVDRDEKLIKDPNEQVSGQLLLGYMRTGRVPWVQFSVFCGESKKLFYRTPQLGKNDLLKIDDKDDNGYIYVVGGGRG